MDAPAPPRGTSASLGGGRAVDHRDGASADRTRADPGVERGHRHRSGDGHLGQHAGARPRHRSADPAPPQPTRGGEGRGARVRRGTAARHGGAGRVRRGSVHPVPAHARSSGADRPARGHRDRHRRRSHRDRVRARHRGQAAPEVEGQVEGGGAAHRRPQQRGHTGARHRRRVGQEPEREGVHHRRRHPGPGPVPGRLDVRIARGVPGRRDRRRRTALDRGDHRRRLLPRRGSRGPAPASTARSIGWSGPRSPPSRTSSTRTAIHGS